MKILIVFLCLLSSCFNRPALMTQCDFDHIQLGTPIHEIRSCIGAPYGICYKRDVQIYEYIERIDLGTQTLVENHYFLTVRDGVVVSKCLRQERPPAYNLIYSDDPNFSQ
jgi:hypothetical protein